MPLADERGDHLRPGHPVRVEGRRHEHQAARCQARDLGEAALRVVAQHAPAAGDARRLADVRPEQAQVVVDLGDRADGRAGVADRVLLRERDRRRDVTDEVHVRALHPLEEEPRVGRERLDEASLTLGIERVEDEARLAGPGDPRDDGQGALRHLAADVAQVVGARALDADRRLQVGILRGDSPTLEGVGLGRNGPSRESGRGSRRTVVRAPPGRRGGPPPVRPGGVARRRDREVVWHRA